MGYDPPLEQGARLVRVRVRVRARGGGQRGPHLALHEMVQRMPSAGAAFHELEHHCAGVTLALTLTLTLTLTRTLTLTLTLP